MEFKKAKREAVKVKLGVLGPSGSGKTLGSLLLAKGLGGKIAVIDTENGSASLYSDKFDFDVLDLTPPYTSKKYIDAFTLAVKAGYDIVVIDSLSHQWASEGGILDRKTKKDLKGGNSFTNWGEFSGEHNIFLQKMLQAPIHVIATVRSKTEYLVEENEKGKKVPKKVGLAPVQRDGLEYEFTTVFDVSHNHYAQATKDRTFIFGDDVFMLSEETGGRIRAWLESGEKPKDKKLCEDCFTELVFNEKRQMHYCPNKKSADDNHTMIEVGKDA